MEQRGAALQAEQAALVAERRRAAGLLPDRVQELLVLQVRS